MLECMGRREQDTIDFLDFLVKAAGEAIDGERLSERDTPPVVLSGCSSHGSRWN